MPNTSDDREPETKMTADAAARIQSAGAKRPDSDTTKSGFAPRAQSAAAKSGHESRKK